MLYTFFLADGSTLLAERQATETNPFRPVKQLERCQTLAEEQAARMRQTFQTMGNGLFVDVVNRCERRKSSGK